MHDFCSGNRSGKNQTELAQTCFLALHCQNWRNGDCFTWWYFCTIRWCNRFCQVHYFNSRGRVKIYFQLPDGAGKHLENRWKSPQRHLGPFDGISVDRRQNQVRQLIVRLEEKNMLVKKFSSFFQIFGKFSLKQRHQRIRNSMVQGDLWKWWKTNCRRESSFRRCRWKTATGVNLKIMIFITPDMKKIIILFFFFFFFFTRWFPWKIEKLPDRADWRTGNQNWIYDREMGVCLGVWRFILFKNYFRTGHWFDSLNRRRRWRIEKIIEIDTEIYDWLFSDPEWLLSPRRWTEKNSEATFRWN